MAYHKHSFVSHSLFQRNRITNGLIRVSLAFSLFGLLMSKSAFAISTRNLTGLSPSIASTLTRRDPAIVKFLSQHQIYNLKDYLHWIKNNLTYSTDTVRDSWASPEETISRKSGDCEDLAFLHAEVLRELGYESRVLAFSKGKDGHVFCVFRKNGNYQIIDNLNYFQTTTNSLEALARFIAANGHGEYLLELHRLPQEIKPIFQMVRRSI